MTNEVRFFCNVGEGDDAPTKKRVTFYVYDSQKGRVVADLVFEPVSIQYQDGYVPLPNSGKFIGYFPYERASYLKEDINALNEWARNTLTDNFIQSGIDALNGIIPPLSDDVARSLAWDCCLYTDEKTVEAAITKLDTYYLCGWIQAPEFRDMVINHIVKHYSKSSNSAFDEVVADYGDSDDEEIKE